MAWNSYGGWEKGVAGYEIYRKVNDEEIFSLKQTVTSGFNQVVFSDISFIKQCYIVRAIQKEGDASSFSNEYCLGANRKLIVSNAVSPNGDNENDRWFIDNIEFYSNVEVKVFNQWNGLVYQKRGYRNEWDGGGLPDGTYYSVVDSGKTKEVGSLLIMKW